jgi:hypothetical protein
VRVWAEHAHDGDLLGEGRCTIPVNHAAYKYSQSSSVDLLVLEDDNWVCLSVSPSPLLTVLRFSYISSPLCNKTTCADVN